jgi:hypothetical protein
MATAIHYLETETFIPPIDIYLSKRLADFESRLQRSGLDKLIEGACKAVRHHLRKQPWRRGQPPPQKASLPLQPGAGERKAAWAKEWAGTPPSSSTSPLPYTWDTEKALLRDWRARWEETSSQYAQLRPGRSPEAADTATFDGSILNLHRDLRKAESSILIQIRTGKVGLRAFLFRRKVPGIESPNCLHCPTPETAFHVIVECPAEEESRAALAEALGEDLLWWTPTRLREAYHNPSQAILIARWLIRSGRLPEYRLALEYAAREQESAWEEGAELP